MPLSLVEKARVRRALGYLQVTNGTSLQFGVPLPTQFLFIVEDRMDQVMEPEGIELVREDLARAEATRDQLFEAQQRLSAKRVGNIETNPEELSALYGQLRFWAGQLAESLGVPAHEFSWLGGKSPAGAGSNGINIPVRNAR